VQVCVGSADNGHAVAANFPTPWAGSPGVIFRGCTGSSCRFDSSALRLVNNTTGDRTIDSVSVAIGSCRINLWPGARTLSPGQQLILTQTAAVPSEGCSPGDGSFDGSDTGQSPCLADGIVPKVTLSIDGTSETLADTYQVLNTGGLDPYGCRRINESIQWALIGGPSSGTGLGAGAGGLGGSGSGTSGRSGGRSGGSSSSRSASSPCAGSSLVLWPALQSARVTHHALVAAIYANGCGTGLQGVKVALVGAAGPERGRVWSAVTNSHGAAFFKLASARTGTDVVFGGVYTAVGPLFSKNLGRVKWMPPVTGTGRSLGASIKLGKRALRTYADTRTRSSATYLRRVARLRGLSVRGIRASRLSAVVKAYSGKVVAQSSLARLTVSRRGVPAISARRIAVASRASCAGAGGRATIGSLTIGNTRISVRHLRPGTVIRFGANGRIVLDELVRSRGLPGLTVNAIHVKVPGVLDVVLGSATAAVRYC
jgi:hypothetical protein